MRTTETWLVAIVVAAVGCASASGPPTKAALPAAGERWIAVQVPPTSDDVAPPIAKVKAFEVFASREDCEAFRIDLMREAGAMGSEGMMDEADAVRCVRAARPSPRPTPAAR